MYRRRDGDRDGAGGPISVRIDPAALDEIAAHARTALPLECCGLLIGTPTEITEAVRSPNIADDPERRFLIEPQTHFEARRRARTRGLSLVGFYHSHPQSEPKPSAADCAEASYAGSWHLIVRPRADRCEARLFRWEETGFVELRLEADDRGHNGEKLLNVEGRNVERGT